jgi:citrate lyase subunit beta/citryl-CoA lyase
MFTPTQDEIKMAQNSLKTLEKASKKGLGVAILDDRMIDAPQIRAARALIERVKLLGVMR